MAVTLSSSTVTQLILVDASSGATTVDLATTGTRCPDVLHVIKKIDSTTNAVTIEDSGGSQIEGGSTLALTNPNDSVVLALDSSANTWRLVSKATAGLGGSELTNGYIPYVSGGLLANSPIYTDGTHVGVGTTSIGTAGLVVGTNVSGAGIDMTSNRIINLATPTSSTDAANKSYVDSAISSIGGYWAASGSNIHNTNSGNVLINTTTDNGNTLQVNGTGWIGGALTATGQVATPTLSLQSSSTPTTPTNGMIYYDSSGNVFKGYQNGAWVNLINTAGVTGSGTANNLTKWTGSGTVGNSVITDNGTSISINGGVRFNVVTISGGIYTLGLSNTVLYVHDVSGVGGYIYLPDGTTCIGIMYVIRIIGSGGTYYIFPYNGQTINGVGTTHASAGSTVELISAGTDWISF